MGGRLSKNFTLGEITRSERAKSLKIDNSIKSKEHLENIKLLVSQILQPLADYLGEPVIITSGYRCLELNTSIGGSKTSAHSTGNAVDFVTRDMNGAFLWIRNNCSFDQLIHENKKKGNSEPEWIHIGIAVKNRGQVLRTDDNGKTYYRI